MTWGLAAKDTVAQMDDGLFFLGRNNQGNVQAAYMAGYQVKPVSRRTSMST